jgi:hypothetical protein
MNLLFDGLWSIKLEHVPRDSVMSSEAEKSAPAVRTPPYVAYKTFLTLIDDLHTHSMPPLIDRSVLKRFSGGVGSQLLMALKSLGLCGDDNRPTQALAEMVAAYKHSQFKAEMRKALDFGYPFLKSIDLMTATPGMFADAFKVTGSKEDVLRKCRRFYLAAAQSNDVQLGPRILGGGTKAPRANNGSAPTPAKKKPKAVKRSDNADGEGNKNRNNTGSTDQTVQQQLLAKFPEFDPAWPDDLKKSWFAGFKDLMAASGTKSGGD